MDLPIDDNDLVVEKLAFMVMAAFFCIKSFQERLITVHDNNKENVGIH